MKNVFLAIAIMICLPSCGWYNNYSREQDRLDAENKGRSMLLEAESSKKVAIETAKANLESAKLNAEADVIRAEGIAKANKIIGHSLEDNKAYLEWLWIDNIEKNPNQVFYIPTENKVPIFVNQQAKQQDPNPAK
jgi:regulator of protease activity HflC (stomatin/prohibitin superfamily)